MRNLKLKWYKNCWHAVWADNGTQRASLGTTDEAEAQRKFVEFKDRVHRASRPPEPTLGEIMDGYIKNRESVGKDAQRMLYSKSAMATLMPLRPEHLTEEEVRDYVEMRQGQGRSPSTINTELGYLRSALIKAARTKWIDKAPFIQMPPKSLPRDRWLERDEAGRLIDGARMAHVRLFIIIALHTAARTAAILDLEWDRVDLERGRIDFNPKLRPITKKKRAIVPINKTLLAALAASKPGALTQFVIEYNGDRVLSVKKGFGNAVQRAGLAGVSPHTLRHTAATWMAQGGTRMRDIAAFLGHDDERTTAKVYAHHHPDYLKGAANALE
ncbi:MAG: site-specific integrase [Gammaproteobacteria bacterium]